MTQELQITTTITDIETKLDKNGQPFYKLSLAGLPHYFYAFSFNLPEEILTALAKAPHHFINRPVLLTYQELPNKDQNGTFFKVQTLQLIT